MPTTRPGLAQSARRFSPWRRRAQSMERGTERRGAAQKEYSRKERPPMPTLDYDVTFAITAYWHAEVFECTSGATVHWTAGFPDREGAMAAAEAFIDAQEDPR
jgi:hypothetical protein